MRSPLGVSSALLFAGLGQQYGSIHLHVTEESLKWMQHIQNSPHIAPFVQAVHLDLDRCYVPYELRAEPSSIPTPHAFSAELSNAFHAFTNVHEININWADFYIAGGWGLPAPYVPERTDGLDTYIDTVADVLEIAGPRLRVLRLKVYVDAIPALARLKPGTMKSLEVFELKVFGGIWPEGMAESKFGKHLAEVALAFILPSAPSLKTLDLVFAPMDDGSRSRIDVTGFFQTLKTSPFPSLTTLKVESENWEDESNLATFIQAGVASGSLRTLALFPSSHQGYNRVITNTTGYMHMINKHGKEWDDLRHLSIYAPWSDVSTFAKQNIDKEQEYQDEQSLRGKTLGPWDDGFFTAFSLLSAIHHLESLQLSGQYLSATQLRALLGTISGPLRRLTINVEEVRPSTIADLATLAPSLDTLHLNLWRAAPDGEVTAGLLEQAQSMVNFSTPSAWAYQYHDDDDFEDDEEYEAMLDEGTMSFLERQVHGTRLRRERVAKGQVRERLFHGEMQEYHFGDWALRRASVVHDWSPGCVVSTPPPRHALNVALALQHALPDLRFMEFSPLRLRWPDDPISQDDDEEAELRMI